MNEHFDARETRHGADREADLLARLPGLIAAAQRAPGWQRHLAGIDPQAVRTRADLAALPVMRKSALIAMQKSEPPFAGLLPTPLRSFARVFTSPGPILEPEGAHDDAWRTGRGLFAAGFRRGDLVLNTFSYHLTPGGFILDSGARAVGCTVIPAGPGNTAQQLELIAALRPTAYTGTPDFLKILLDAAAEAGVDTGCLRRAVVSGAAFPPSLQAQIKAHGIDAYQHYATADVGLIAYETAAREGMVVNEDIMLEVVRPGTGEPLADGEVGEIVITSFDADHPWVRLALGDLSAIEPFCLTRPSSCGRTNARIRGWLGRADQTTKVKGLFVRPEQVAEVMRRHPQIRRARLIVRRENELDVAVLRIETEARDAAHVLEQQVAGTVREVTQLGAAVECVAPGVLPNDGKLVDDCR